MTKTDTDTTHWSRLWDLPAALVLLTRLPLPTLPDHAFANGARAVWAYPLVGLVLGLILAALASILSGVGVSAPVNAGVVLGALILLTGAMHEDGLADSADGLWGGHNPAQRLDIMKDSRIGAYGVLALIVALGLRWLGLAEVSWTSLVAALILSRAMMPPLMYALPHARKSGLSHSVGAANLSDAALAVGLGCLVALIFVGWAAMAAALVSGAVATGIGILAKRKIGGQTGDILGATCILTEITVLLTLSAI